jgi:hypothetical protein
MKVNLLLGICFIFSTLFGSATPITPIISIVPEGNMEITEQWQEYTTIDDVRIEFKRKLCTPNNGRAQNLILFKYTNLSNDVKTMSWILKVWRNDFCVTCNTLANPENAHSVTLQPNQTIEADGSSAYDTDIYIFDNYIKLVPGMQDQRLTNFELIDLNVQ